MVWNEERSAGELADQFDVSFGAVSQHLSKLRDAGYVTVRSEGNHRFYRADIDRLKPFIPLLEGMWSAMLDQLVQDVEDQNA